MACATWAMLLTGKGHAEAVERVRKEFGDAAAQEIVDLGIHIMRVMDREHTCHFKAYLEHMKELNNNR